MSFNSILFTTLVLSTGAFVQAMEQDNIHKAAERGDVAAVTSFLDRGANVNQPNNDGCTPLLMATIIGHATLVNLLLDRGANVNHLTKKGATPLHIAAGLGYDITVSLFLNHGANPLLKMVSGKIPFDLVSEEKTEIRELLLNYQELWQRKAFLAGKHHRTGANSPIRELPTDIIKDNIFSHLWPQNLSATESTAEAIEVGSTPAPTAAEPSIIKILQAKGIAGAHIQQLQHIQVTHSKLLETFSKLSCQQKERLATSIQSLNDEITEIMKAMTNLLGLFNHSYEERNSQEQERIQQKLDGHDKMALNRLLILEKLIKKQQ